VSGSTTGYNIPSGGPSWFKNQLSRLREKIDEVRRATNEVARRVSRAPSSGSTAERDLLYGIPSTDADRVELANRQVSWLNTDTGFVESYFMVAGAPGLTARGLAPNVTKVAAGWYPVGPGPYVALHPNAQFGATSGNFLGNWSSPRDRRRGGSDWFEYTPDGLLTVKKAGVYDLSWWTTMQVGSGTANFWFVIHDTPAKHRYLIDGLAYTLSSSFYTHAHGELNAAVLGAGDKVGVYCNNGSLVVHIGGSTAAEERLVGGQLAATYLGPPLAFQ
jgi:hypothetical protein